MNINIEHVDQMVVKAVTDVFNTMLQTSVQLDDIQRPESPEGGGNIFQTLDDTLVVGTVGFTGKVTGMSYLCIPEKTAKLISVRMLGLDSEDEADVELVNDAIGELSNMCSGTFKNQIADLGYYSVLTIPSIIRGKYFVMDTPEASVRTFCRFRYQDRLISMEVLLKETQD